MRPIREGDYVRVLFADGETIYGDILHTPSDTGDLLYIKQVHSEHIYGINQSSASFKYMQLREDREFEF